MCFSTGIKSILLSQLLSKTSNYLPCPILEGRDLSAKWHWKAEVNLDKFQNQFAHKAPQNNCGLFDKLYCHRPSTPRDLNLEVSSAFCLILQYVYKTHTCSSRGDCKSFDLCHQQHGRWLLSKLSYHLN